jgi:hypothetical protein
MNKKILTGLFIFCVVLAFVVSDIQAQLTSLNPVDVNNKKTGTAAGVELLIPVGGRGMAMSGATVATSVGIDAMYWNPAGLARIGDQAEGMFSNMAYIADISVNYGAVAIKFGTFGTIGLSVKALGFGDIPFTTVDDPEGIAGRVFSPSFITVGGSYARQFTDAITAGINFKMISENLHRVTGSGIAFDIGLQYDGVAGFEGVKLGVVLKNMGPEMKFDGTGLLKQAIAVDGRRPRQFYSSLGASFQLPTSVEIGLAYDQKFGEAVGYNINSGYEANSLYLDSYRFGGEVTYDLSNIRLAGRGGIDLIDGGPDDENIFGPTFGFGLLFKTEAINITIDYAYRTVDYFSSNNMFSLMFGF